MPTEPFNHYRPREGVNRTNRLNLRFTDAEYARILKAATRNGLLPSSWAADILIELTIPKKRPKKRIR